MKILILNNFFNQYNEIPIFNKSRFFSKFYKKYNLIKLEKLISKLKIEYNNKVEFKIISGDNEELNVKGDVDVESPHDFHYKIEREEFLKVIKKIKSGTKINLKHFYTNLRDKKATCFQTSLGKLMEFEFIDYFKKLFGEFELIRQILRIEEYDKVILFNYNPNFSEFINYLCSKYNNLELYQDPILRRINKRLHLYIINFFLSIIRESLKGLFMSKYHFKDSYIRNKKKNIVFFGYKPKKMHLTPFQSTKPIYNALRKHRNFCPIYFHRIKKHLTLWKLPKLIKILFQIKKIWNKYQDKICLNMEYDSINLHHPIREFFNFILYFQIILCFIFLNHFEDFLKKYPTSLILTSVFDGSKITALLKYCQINKISTIYIPLAANLLNDEKITISDFTHITVAGEKNKEYFVSKGEPEDKIIITGRPRYDFFYTGKLNKLAEVNDMFSDRIYKFKPNKFTILFSSSTDLNDITMPPVIKSLKESNLINNLIIKLHPAEDITRQKKFMEKLKVNPIIVRDYNIFEIIKSCDLLLSVRSTSILEAMIVGTPAILLDLDIEQFWRVNKHQFLEESLLIKVENQKKLTEVLEKFSNNKDLYLKYSDAIHLLSKKYSYYDEKESSVEKIVKLILNLCYI